MNTATETQWNGRPDVMVVEDDARLRELLREELDDEGFAVQTAATSAQAWTGLAERPVHAVVTDLRLPGEDGMALLRRIRSLSHAPAVLIITAFGTVSQAVEALKAGADDFLTKPINLDHLVLALRRAIHNRRLQDEVNRFQQMLGPQGFHGILGQSRPMRQLFDLVARIARATGPVLITGESGTGKELVARALHAESDRADGPFIAVNCAGIPAELLESEFFGHTAGAFTGARSARAGLFAEAEGGTLLLDEVGDMPRPLQAKLLRVLQDGRIRPVGGARERTVDVRILAATNQVLEDAVRTRRFRKDLYYRIETFGLDVPPLRDRDDDLDLLAAHFLERAATGAHRPVRGFSQDAMRCLRRYGFPGNVRELANVVERAVIYCDGREIDARHLPERLRMGIPAAGKSSARAPDPLLDGEELPPLREIEERYIKYVLDRASGNKRQAAAILEIGRRTLYRRLGRRFVDEDAEPTT